MHLPELPALDDLGDLQVVALPLRTRFRGIDTREVLLLRGPAGWGEFAPFTEYDDAESAWWLAAGLEHAWLGAPIPVRSTVDVNATVPAVRADHVAGVLSQFPGCTCVKVKVADGPLAQDLARVAAVRSALGPGARVRVDANGLWSVDQAVVALHAFAQQGPLEYAEQPCAGVAELAAVRARVGVPIAADESIRRVQDPVQVARAAAADVAVLKVAPLGGMRRVLALAAELRVEYGLPVVISSALDSAVGVSAGLAVAGALPELPLACGLATGGLLAADVTADVRPVGGVLAVRAVVPDPKRLRALAASPERRQWWMRRLQRCHALLAAEHPAWPPPAG